MVIWQAMKGHYQNPKRVWNHRDLEHQHFTESTGWHFQNKVKKDDLMLIYLPGPGNKAFMGLQKAAEDGPYELSPSVPGARPVAVGTESQRPYMDPVPPTGDWSPRIESLSP